MIKIFRNIKVVLIAIGFLIKSYWKNRKNKGFILSSMKDNLKEKQEQFNKKHMKAMLEIRLHKENSFKELEEKTLKTIIELNKGANSVT